MVVPQPVWPCPIGTHPIEFRVRTATDELNQCQRVIDCSETRLIHLRAHPRFLVRVHVELAADVQDSARCRQLSDRLRMFEIIMCAHHEEVPINGGVPWRAPISGGTPVAKSVPKHESYKRVVD